MSLADDFRTTDASVLRAMRLCNPVDQDGEGIHDGTAHLECYATADAPGGAPVNRTPP